MKQQYTAYLYKRNQRGTFDLAVVGDRSAARWYRKAGYRDTTEERFAEMWAAHFQHSRPVQQAD